MDYAESTSPCPPSQGGGNSFFAQLFSNFLEKLYNFSPKKLFLRLSQIFKYQRDLPGSEQLLRHPIVCFFQSFGKLGVSWSRWPDCWGLPGTKVGSVGLSQFAFVVGTMWYSFFFFLVCLLYCKDTQNQLYTQCITCNSVKNYGKKCDFAEISGKIKRRLSLCQDGWISRFTGCGEELFMLLCVWARARIKNKV